METPKTLFQYCDHCKDEKVFNFDTVTCKTCGNKCANYKPKIL